MAQSYKSFTGSASELIHMGVTVNGKPLDAVGCSILHRYGAIKAVGTEAKPEHRRGRAGVVFKVQGKPGFVVESQQQQTIC